MRWYNFLIYCVVLWVAAWVFPNVVYVRSVGTLIVVVLLLWVATLVIGFLSIAAAGVSIVCGGCCFAILCFVAMMFAEVLALGFCSEVIDGFSVVGFWPKVLLSACFSMFSVQNPS